MKKDFQLKNRFQSSFELLKKIVYIDFLFAKKYGIKVVQVLEKSGLNNTKIFDPLLWKEWYASKENCLNDLTEDLFATDEVYNLVKQGIPFRDAYRTIAKKLSRK